MVASAQSMALLEYFRQAYQHLPMEKISRTVDER